MVVFEGKLDRAARLREAVRLPDKQNAGSVQGLNNVRQVKTFQSAHENHLALSDRRDVFEALDGYRPVGDGLTLKNFIDRLPKRIRTEDANDEGRLGISKTCWRPIDELRKV